MGTELLTKIHCDEPPASPLPEPCSWAAPNSGADPWNASVVDLLRDSVRRYPHAPAISDGHWQMTYAELWNFAGAFRSRLVLEGVGPGDRVGVAGGRSIPTVAAILGIVLAGGCYVPIDFDGLPPHIVGRLAGQCDLRCWIADRDALHSADSSVWGATPVLQIEEISCPAGEDPLPIAGAGIHPDSPIYIMFTSGSTGLPKGVVVPHRAVARLVSGQSFIEFDPGQTFLLHSPLTFDASTLEVWGALLHGGKLAIAPPHRLGIDEYASVIANQGVTTLWLTAAMFHLAAEHAPEMFAPLGQLLFGGDVIAPAAVEQIRRLYPALRMVNGYGPTENTTFTCCYVVPGDYRAGCPLPIGSPIAQTTVHVLDSDHLPISPGQEGELAAGGAGVALGYLGQPEATAQRFLLDGFSDRPGATLYLTGDRVRQRPDGIVEFLGRLDNQVKIAGQRVELDAVESALTASPMIAQAAVIVLAPATAEKQLAACVSLSRPASDAEAQIRNWLGDRLSRASIPQHWLVLDRLPINANGKLDRSALRSRCEQQFLSAQATLPTNWAREAAELATEPQIAQYLGQLWAALLNRTSVAEEENFFDLGGTSLLLIEMHSRLKTRFTSVPSLVEMFALPTPGALAERLHSGRELPRELNPAEQRGERQRKAMLTRRTTVSRTNGTTAPVAAEGDRL